MILSDNETRLDLLNNRAIAKTIVSIIKDSKGSVSIGVHGDWGAGKSSILAMVEDLLNPKQSDDDKLSLTSVDEDDLDWDTWEDCNERDDAADEEPAEPVTDLITVRFNSWQYQGFEDAKIALMSAIVKALQKKAKDYYKKHPVKGAFKKLKGISKRIWKNLDKLSLAKNVGKAGVSLATGTTPLALLEIGANYAKDIFTDQKKREEFLDTAGELLKESSSDSSSYKEMTEFRTNYKELFKAAHIEKLVVLIDDLDRCLPKVAIETLEAVRMFLAMEHAAFIIAADDAMIRYSVKEYFPRVIEQENEDVSKNLDYNQFSDKYLEKLIQVPLHIPRIGIAEAQLYILLLMAESKTGESDELKALAETVISKLSKPWALEQLTTEEIQKVMGTQYDSVIENVIIAKSIDRILAENTGGNPRNIKRFVNMLLLRTEVAHNRGFDEKELEMSVLCEFCSAF
jgi:predicted KAP-like P-loop ATPase